jgi:hypothetical protein
MPILVFQFIFISKMNARSGSQCGLRQFNAPFVTCLTLRVLLSAFFFRSVLELLFRFRVILNIYFFLSLTHSHSAISNRVRFQPEKYIFE